MSGRMMKDDALWEQFKDLKDRIGTILEDGEVELPMAVTVLTAMLIDTALNQMEIPAIELISKFTRNVNDVVKFNAAFDKFEEEDDEQADSRTTH